jgi:Cu(I)/Ag(I) efflux system membrane fusion protein
VGARGDGYVEVLDGIREGENVVVAANFLIDSESNLRSALNAFGSQDAKPGARAAAVVHRGVGRIEAVDLAQASATLAHGPIASLKWPGMTMDFKVKDPALLRTLKPGQSLGFEFVAAAGGDYTIVRVQPAAAKPDHGSAPAAGAKAAAAVQPVAGARAAAEPGSGAGAHKGH